VESTAIAGHRPVGDLCHASEGGVLHQRSFRTAYVACASPVASSGGTTDVACAEFTLTTKSTDEPGPRFASDELVTARSLRTDVDHGPAASTQAPRSGRDSRSGRAAARAEGSAATFIVTVMPLGRAIAVTAH
jgi:hypothetical protein